MFGDNGERIVGRFYVDFEVANYRDVMRAEEGLIKPTKVRRQKLRGLVDTGANRLILPSSVVKKLGLPVSKQVRVVYADRRTAIRDAVADVHIELLGRSGVFSAIVEPKRRDALIGAIVLEELDFIVDPTGERLMPRDPRFVISEAE
jgi:clan AA aspartic protease